MQIHRRVQPPVLQLKQCLQDEIQRKIQECKTSITLSQDSQDKICQFQTSQGKQTATEQFHMSDHLCNDRTHSCSIR